MTADRQILNRTAELLLSAVRHIDMLVAWLGGDEDAGFGGLATKGAVKELTRLGSEIVTALSDASVFITDQWPYIENNKARLFEMGRFFEVYDRFHASVMAYDDARIDNEARSDELLGYDMQPQEYVMMIARFDREFSFPKEHLNDVVNGNPAKRPLEGLADRLMHKYCIGVSDETLENLIRYHETPALKGTWIGDKRFATYFGHRCNLECADMNATFDFFRDDDRSRKIQLNYSKNDDIKVPENCELARILDGFPIDSIKYKM